MIEKSAADVMLELLIPMQKYSSILPALMQDCNTSIKAKFCVRYQFCNAADCLLQTQYTQQEFGTDSKYRFGTRDHFDYTADLKDLHLQKEKKQAKPQARKQKQKRK